MVLQRVLSPSYCHRSLLEALLGPLTAGLPLYSYSACCYLHLYGLILLPHLAMTLLLLSSTYVPPRYAANGS